LQNLRQKALQKQQAKGFKKATGKNRCLALFGGFGCTLRLGRQGQTPHGFVCSFLSCGAALTPRRAAPNKPFYLFSHKTGGFLFLQDKTVLAFLAWTPTW